MKTVASSGARYIIRYDGGSEATIPVRFGQEIHGGWRRKDEPIPAPPRASVVWRGRNPVADRGGYALVLYLMPWENPRPNRVVNALDLESAMTDSSVGVIAITAL